MKIGLIIFSQTGNTLSVASQLKEKLAGKGHSVQIEELKAVGEVRPDNTELRIEKMPDLGQYDALVFGSPVMAFSLNPAMALYLKQVSSIQKAKTACFVTHFFPFAWMGGTIAVRQMKSLIESKGVSVADTGVINWSNGRRPKEIEELVERISTQIVN